MSDDIFNHCISFISDYLSVDKTKLTSETQICEDLGVDGDDALELIAAFAKEFNVDISSFEFDKHFSSEGFNPFLSLWHLIFKREKLYGTPITIQDLVHAAETKKWSK